MLRRAWDRRELADDDRLSATIAQRSAFLATSRLRGREAIEWAERAVALAPEDPANGLLVAAVAGAGIELHRQAIPGPRRARPLAGRSLGATARRRLRPARAQGVPAAGRGRPARRARGVRDLGGRGPGARPARRRRAVALGPDPRPVPGGRVGQRGGLGRACHRARDRVRGSLGDRPGALVARATCRPLVGDWAVADAHVRAIHAQSPTFERHVAAESIAAAGLAAAQDRPGDVLRALEPLEQMEARRRAWGTRRSCRGTTSRRTRSSTSASSRPPSGSSPLPRRSRRGARTRCWPRGSSTRAAGSSSPVTISVGPRPCSQEARAMVESIGVPYEQGLIELTRGQVLRRAGERRAAAATLVAAQGRFSALGAQPRSESLREGARCVWLGAVAAQDARLPRPDAAGARGHAAGRLRHDQPRGVRRS